MYLDPGSGSIIFQMVLAALLGAGVILRVFWKKITGLFKKKDKSEENNINKEFDL